MLEAIGLVVAIVTGVSGLILSLFSMKRGKDAEAKAERQSRLLFLSGIILDKNIAKSSRQIAYDEYIALGGNSAVVRIWLEEVSKG